jgi:hypothetical protein
MRRTVTCGLLAVGVAAGCSDNANTPVDPDPIVVPVYSRGFGDISIFHTHAKGRNEVPPNDSRAQGIALFSSRGGDRLGYTLIVANIENVTQSHIHLAPAGVNGGIVAWLYPSAPPSQLIPGRSQGVLASGIINDDDVIGDLDGLGVEGLLEAIRAGNTYVNVHTSQFPPGEIRGQIR